MSLQRSSGVAAKTADLPPMLKARLRERLHQLGVSPRGAEQIISGQPVSLAADRSIVAHLLAAMLGQQASRLEIFDYPGEYAQRGI
jgi:hypothetical protein